MAAASKAAATSMRRRTMFVAEAGEAPSSAHEKRTAETVGTAHERAIPARMFLISLTLPPADSMFAPSSLSGVGSVSTCTRKSGARLWKLSQWHVGQNRTNNLL